MKVFLITSLLLLGVALSAAILVFVFVSSTVDPAPSAQRSSGTPSAINQEGVALRSLSFTEGQREALVLADIDIETRVVTPAVRQCLEEMIGKERTTWIIAGAVPDFTEVTSLIQCLNVD